MNGRDLRLAIEAEFKDVWEWDCIDFNVRTKHGRSYELPKLEVYVTHTPNYGVYEDLCEFVLDWFSKNKRELKVKGRKEYAVVRGFRFPTRNSDYESVTDVEIILSAFAL